MAVDPRPRFRPVPRAPGEPVEESTQEAQRMGCLKAAHDRRFCSQLLANADWGGNGQVWFGARSW